MLGHDTHREREPLGTCILDFAFLFEAAGIFLCAVAGGLRDLDTTGRFQESRLDNLVMLILVRLGPDLLYTIIRLGY